MYSFSGAKEFSHNNNVYKVKMQKLAYLLVLLSSFLYKNVCWFKLKIKGVLELPVIQGHSITGQYHSSSSFLFHTRLQRGHYRRKKRNTASKKIYENLHNKRNESEIIVLVSEALKWRYVSSFILKCRRYTYTINHLSFLMM